MADYPECTAPTDSPTGGSQAYTLSSAAAYYTPPCFVLEVVLVLFELLPSTLFFWRLPIFSIMGAEHYDSARIGV